MRKTQEQNVDVLLEHLDVNVCCGTEMYRKHLFFSELDTKLGMVVQQNIFTAFDLELTLPYKF